MGAVIVSDIVQALKGTVSAEGEMSRPVLGCYVSDLLSDVLANSKLGDLWITHHTHSNVVAVAAVKELSAVVIVGGKPADADALARARVEGVTIILSAASAFEAAGAVYAIMKPEPQG